MSALWFLVSTNLIKNLFRTDVYWSLHVARFSRLTFSRLTLPRFYKSTLKLHTLVPLEKGVPKGRGIENEIGSFILILPPPGTTLPAAGRLFKKEDRVNLSPLEKGESRRQGD
jgi:hypothetical protein